MMQTYQSGIETKDKPRNEPFHPSLTINFLNEFSKELGYFIEKVNTSYRSPYKSRRTALIYSIVSFFLLIPSIIIFSLLLTFERNLEKKHPVAYVFLELAAATPTFISFFTGIIAIVACCNIRKNENIFEPSESGKIPYQEKYKDQKISNLFEHQHQAFESLKKLLGHMNLDIENYEKKLSTKELDQDSKKLYGDLSELKKVIVLLREMPENEISIRDFLTNLNQLKTLIDRIQEDFFLFLEGKLPVHFGQNYTSDFFTSKRLQAIITDPNIYIDPNKGKVEISKTEQDTEENLGRALLESGTVRASYGAT